MSLTLMHLADIHLGAPLKWMGAKTAERQRDLVYSFSRAVEHAIKHVDLVLLAGDIFDSHRPSEELVTFFRGQVQRLHQAGIQVVVVPGNHDGYFYPDSVWRTREFPNLTLITSPRIDTPVTLEVKGIPVNIYGMAYQSTLSGGSFDTFKRNDDPGIHVALIHGSLLHNPQWGIHKRDIPLDPVKLGESGMDYIALGHYHRFSKTDVQGIPIVYPGSLEGLNLQETGDKYLVTVTFDNGNTAIHQQVFQSRTIHDLTIDVTGWEESNTEHVTTHIAQLVDQPQDIYQITLTGAATEVIDVSRVQEQLGEHCFLAQVSDQTMLLKADTINRIAKEPTIRGGFVRAVQQRLDKDSTIEPEVAELALRIGLQQFMEGK